jgi:hypothetical protein
LRKALLLTLIGLFLVPTAYAAVIQGPALKASGRVAAKTVTLKLTVTAAYNQTGPAGSIKLSNCKFGQQTPLQLASGALPRDSQGRLTWRFASVPPKSAGSLVKTLHLALPQGKGGPEFCVHIQMRADGFGNYQARELRIPLRSS